MAKICKTSFWLGFAHQREKLKKNNWGEAKASLLFFPEKISISLNKRFL
jgi:hypothetical protein